MLRANEGVVEFAGFLLGVDENSTGPIGESFEHDPPHCD
jgi:hypothetical protein